MMQEILKEYQALVASHFVQAESDALARKNLASLATDLRRDMKSIVASIDQNPGEKMLHAYLGVMFYEAFTSNKVKLIRDLSSKGTSGAEAIAQIRKQSALQIAKPAIEGARWLEAQNVDHLWTSIQLALAAPGEKTWADQAIAEDDEDDDSKDDRDDQNDEDEDTTEDTDHER
jgi:hypothetical protein